MVSVRPAPRSELVPGSLHTRAFPTLTLGPVADQPEHVATELIVVSSQSDGAQLDSVAHG